MLAEEYKTRKSFQFCNVWTRHPQFLSIIQEGWNENIERCMMYKVDRILKMLKRSLRLLHSQEFQNIVSQANKDRAELKKGTTEVANQSQQPGVSANRKSYVSEI